MGARQRVSSPTNTHLNTFAELLHKHKPVQAVARFSQYLEHKPLDVISENAVHYVTRPVQQESPREELLSRVQYTKSQIETCKQHLAEIATAKLNNRVVVVHPLDSLSASVLTHAKHIRFFEANQATAHVLPVHKLRRHRARTVPDALDGAHAVLLEARAVTNKGMIAHQGARLLMELARARGIPMYGLATSWHVTPRQARGERGEFVPAKALTGIISEHGIYAHDQFLARVQKTFPWLF